MRIFAVLAALLVGGGILIALYWSADFSLGAWFTGGTLLAFAFILRALAQRELRGRSIL
jgi:hypothetical protein